MVRWNVSSALKKIGDRVDKGVEMQELGIGVEVGYVNVVEAKDEIMEGAFLPMIVFLG